MGSTAVIAVRPLSPKKSGLLIAGFVITVSADCVPKPLLVMCNFRPNQVDPCAPTAGKVKALEVESVSSAAGEIDVELEEPWHGWHPTTRRALEAAGCSWSDIQRQDKEIRESVIKRMYKQSSHDEQVMSDLSVQAFGGGSIF